MQNRSLVIFGTHPILSLAELVSWAEARGLVLDILSLTGPVALLEGLDGRQLVNLPQELAGVVKVAEVITDIQRDRPSTEAAIGDCLAHVLEKTNEVGSLTFGLSFHGSLNAVTPPAAQEHIALTLKKQLRQHARHIRWVNGRGQPLSSVHVTKNKLTETGGVELIVLSTAERFVVARTLAVQEFADWGERDFGRPRRNAKQGMLPPKLARIMVNLLGLSPKGTLLDPFCGSGTVLMEASMLGWQRLIGSDLNRRAIEDTKQNIDWLQKRQASLGSLVVKLQVSRVEDLGHSIPSASVRAMVTEPFLGPPLTHRPSRPEVMRLQRDLLPLYRTLGQTIANLLELNGRAVVILPLWILNNGDLETLPSLVQSLPESLRLHDPLEHVRGHERSALQYRRPDQYVGREIIILEKVSRSDARQVAQKFRPVPGHTGAPPHFRKNKTARGGGLLKSNHHR